MSKDLRPIVRRNETNGLTVAEAALDAVGRAFEDAAGTVGVEVLILKSPPFTAPPWVKIEAWVPNEKDHLLSIRSCATVIATSLDFHRFPVLFELQITDNNRSKTWRSITSFTQSNASEVLDYILCRRTSKRFRFQQCRRWPFQIWRPANKVDRFGRDWSSVFTQILFFSGLLTFSYGIGVILMIVSGLLAYSNYDRRRYVLSAGKPSQEPRRLVRVDSWQTMVHDLGAERNTIRAALIDQISSQGDPPMLVAPEAIWYWGVDGKEEREQVVVRFRRALAFIHIYSYGADLYVSWDAHVNCGTWQEHATQSGYEKSTGSLCTLNIVSAGWHSPNEYDITDADCLIERVHFAVTQLVKLKIIEHKIDQDIDFSIIREQRQTIVGRTDPNEQRAAKVRRLG